MHKITIEDLTTGTKQVFTGEGYRYEISRKPKAWSSDGGYPVDFTEWKLNITLDKVELEKLENG